MPKPLRNGKSVFFFLLGHNYVNIQFYFNIYGLLKKKKRKKSGLTVGVILIELFNWKSI